jgi:hypothetical protein
VAGEAVDPIALIREELFRLRARPEDVGPVEGITVSDSGHGYAVLQTSPRNQRRLDHHERAEQILERLRGLPDDAGPAAIHSEFA